MIDKMLLLTILRKLKQFYNQSIHLFIIMSSETVAYRIWVITVGEPKPGDDVVTSDDFEETMNFVQESLKELYGKKTGQWIRVVEHVLAANGTYVKGENLFNKSYLIE